MHAVSYDADSQFSVPCSKLTDGGLSVDDDSSNISKVFIYYANASLTLAIPAGAVKQVFAILVYAALKSAELPHSPTLHSVHSLASSATPQLSPSGYTLCRTCR